MKFFIDCIFCRREGNMAHTMFNNPAKPTELGDSKATVTYDEGTVTYDEGTVTYDEEAEVQAAIVMQAAARGKLARRKVHPITESLVDVTLTKVEGRILGVVLADVAAVHVEAGSCVVAIVDHGGLVAETKKVQAGDLVRKVNNVPVTSFQHATQLIKDSPSSLTLTLTKDAGLPEGWVELSEQVTGRTYYKRGNQRTHFHPLTQK